LTAGGGRIYTLGVHGRTRLHDGDVPMYGSSAIFFTPGGIFLGVCVAVAALVWVFAQTPRAERGLRWRAEFAGVLVAAAVILLVVLLGMML
jgi:hypothetical protein